jgi:RNA polymerase sigma-70 factor (ECF subfamily)
MNADLIQSSRQGDLDAFNRLVLENQKRVFNHAYRMLGSFEAADDVTQETFIRAYRKLHQFRGGSFLSWVLRIATNLCFDEMRYRKRHPAQPLEPENEYGEEIESPAWVRDPNPLPEEIVDTVELGEAIQQALNKLSPDFRLTVTLVDIQELDYAEAAVIMGVSIGTVKSRLARARAQLRKTLKPAPVHAEDQYAYA